MAPLSDLKKSISR